jgi:hypothetical protein
MNNVEFADGKILFSDNVDATALYMLGNQQIYSVLSAKYSEVMARETFNYLDNSQYYQELQTDAGHSDDDPYVPKAYLEQNTTLIKMAYALVGIIIHPLEKMLTNLAGLIYKIAWPLF